MRISRIKIIAGGLVVLAIGSCMGNTSCGSGTAANGSSGSGSLVAVGNVPVEIAHPVGVAVHGKHAGYTVWILAGGTLGAIAAAEAHAAHLVGGASNELTTPGDPCFQKTTKTKVASWRKGRVYLDCAGLSQFRRQYPHYHNLQKVLRCIERVITLGARTDLTTGPYSIAYRYDSYAAGKSTISTVTVQPSGRIFSVSSESWTRCGQV